MNEETLGVSTAERLRRVRRIGTTFGRIYLGVRAQRFVARRLQPPDMAARWQHFHHTSAESIYDAAVELRGLILKGCQFLGTRADVLPREYVTVLSRLQDRVPPRPFRVVRPFVEGELGCKLEEVFEEFGRRPIASASLAQVHEARLRDGRRVAVKVQYPEIETLVKSDLANLRLLFRAVGFLERDFDLMPLIDELSAHVPLELDFESEGRNAEAVARDLKDRDDVAVPDIVWPLTTKKLLVMDFMDGIKITEVGKLRAAGLDVDQVAHTLIEVFCEQILLRGFFHADPHPGNIFVQPTASGAPRLVLLDFGLAKALPAHFREGILAFAAALMRGEPDLMAQALFDLGFETRDGERESLLPIARFILDAAIQVRENARLDRDLAERLGRQISDEIRENPVVRIPSHVVLLARVVGLLSGVIRSLESRVDLLPTILPYALGTRSPR